MARVGPADIDLCEVHDCFTIAEILAIEDLGFFKKGQGGPATLSGETAIGGRIPINTSGGLKACGHPVGATGITPEARRGSATWQTRSGRPSDLTGSGAWATVTRTSGGRHGVVQERAGDDRLRFGPAVNKWKKYHEDHR